MNIEDSILFVSRMWGLDGADYWSLTLSLDLIWLARLVSFQGKYPDDF